MHSYNYLTCTLTITYFFNFVNCNQCSSHPPKTAFTSHSLLLPFCCCSPHFHMHPFNWLKATVMTCTLKTAYFWLSCNWCSSCLSYTTLIDFRSLLLLFCYWCSNFHMHLFKYLFSIKATVITCTLMTANFLLSCNWCSYLPVLDYLNLNNLHLSQFSRLPCCFCFSFTKLIKWTL